MQTKFWAFLHDGDKRATQVTVLKTLYCHNAPVTYIVSDGCSIYEFHGTLYYEDPGLMCDWFVPMNMPV